MNKAVGDDVMLLECFIPEVANLFVREVHLVLFKHEAGRTIVFIKHGTGRTIELQPKFQNSSLFLAYLYFW